jgi:hypothetical protein
MKEILEQKDLMEWVVSNMEAYPKLKWLAHIPNEGGYIRGVGPASKKIGINDGVPDFTLPVRTKRYAGLWIELKRPHKKRDGEKKAVSRGAVKPRQREWIEFLNDNGYFACVCYGAQQAIDELIKYLEDAA